MTIFGKCNVCMEKKLWDKGQEIIVHAKIQCPQCSTVFNFEPTRWRVLVDFQEAESTSLDNC